MVFPLLGAAIGAASAGIQLAGSLQAAAGEQAQAAAYVKMAKYEKKQAKVLKHTEKLQYRQSKKLLNLQKKQMLLDFARQRRAAIRQAIVARSESASAAANQGALGSSGFYGGQYGITAEETRNRLANLQNEKLGRRNIQIQRRFGRKIHKDNQKYAKYGIKIADAKGEAAEAGGQIAAGNGLSALGNAIGGVSSSLQNLGTFAFGSSSG